MGAHEPRDRRRLPLRAELALALLPTATVLVVFALVEAWTRQRLLFASLASSAFLIYLDPTHHANSARTLVLAQGLAALIGFLAHAAGASYWTAGGAMVAVILGMVLLDAVHPPAVATALSFAYGAGAGHNLGLFGLCLALILLLLGLQRGTLWLTGRLSGGTGAEAKGPRGTGPRGKG